MNQGNEATIVCGGVRLNAGSMTFPGIRPLPMLAVLVLVAGSSAPAFGAALDAATQAAAKSFEAKVQILGDSKSPPPTRGAVIISDFETNAYLKVHSGEFLPPGVSSPSVKVQPEHAVGEGNIDFEQLSRSAPNEMGPKVLAAMFHGTQHVTVALQVQSEAAGVRLQIESIVVGSMNVPRWLIDVMIQNFIQPRYHVDLSKPLPYPDHVTRIVLGSGQVTFLRGPKPSH